jgi:DNA-directed RNA polymerase specialized sigma24 family protein
MTEPKNPVRALLDQQDWSDVSARLVAFASYRAGSPALGKDLAQEAVTRVYAYESKWDPKKDPDLARYLMSVVNSLLANERSSAAGQRTSSIETKRVQRAAMKVSDPQAVSEDKLADTDLFTRRLTLLTERMAGDADVLRLIELMVEGVDTPVEIRKRTGWSAEVTAAARKRMLRGAAVVARDIGGATDDDPPRSLDGDDDDAEQSEDGKEDTDDDDDGEEVA